MLPYILEGVIPGSIHCVCVCLPKSTLRKIVLCSDVDSELRMGFSPCLKGGVVHRQQMEELRFLLESFITLQAV